MSVPSTGCLDPTEARFARVRSAQQRTESAIWQQGRRGSGTAPDMEPYAIARHARALLPLLIATLAAAPVAAQRTVTERAAVATHGLADVREAYFDAARNVIVLRNGASIRQYDGAGRIATEPDGGNEAATCPFPGAVRDRFEWDATLGARRYANGQWSAPIANAFEPPRGAGSIHHMVLDTTRQRAVLAVNRWGAGVQSYWEFDGATWTNLGNTPGVARCMAFDAGRGRTVVIDHTFRQWEWDGVRWYDRGVSFSITGQRVLGMCYDSRRNRLVLCGDNSLFATFFVEYDGSTWRGHNVVPVFNHTTLAYDHGRALTYVFGDRSGGGPEVWTWDGTALTQRSAPVGRPSARDNAMMASTSWTKLSSEICVLFGGRTANGSISDETWTWDGTAWAQLSLNQRPSSRSAGAMATGSNGSVLLVGGIDGTTGAGLADTWSYDALNGWLLRLTSPLPARYNHAMAFDGTTTWMFGGIDNATPYGDLRYYDTTGFPERWRVVNVTGGPSPRHTHAMTCDTGRRRLVVFGGLDVNATALDETWEYDLQAGTWSVANGVVRPSPRINSSLVYDPSSRHCVLIGGYEWNTGRFLDELWEWNGTTWQQRPPETSTLGPIENLAATWHLDRIVGFGGQPGFSVPPSGAHYEVRANTTRAALAQNFPFELEVTSSPSQSAPLATTPLKLRVPGHGAFVMLGFNAGNSAIAQWNPPFTCVPQTLFVDPVAALFVPENTEYTLNVPIGYTGTQLCCQAVTLSPANCLSLTTAWRTEVRWLFE